MSDQSIKKPTIYDLAKLADVSPGTVSRVLNNKDRVNQETRARVLDLAHKIGLKPRSSVRNKEIAVVTEPQFADRSHGYASMLSSHVAFSLSERGASMSLPIDPINQLPQSFFDGVIAITYMPEIRAMLKKLEEKVPVVYLDNFQADEDQYVVRSNHYQSGYQAARHFVERGMQKPTFLAADSEPAAVRLSGFIDGLTESGLSAGAKQNQLMQQTDSLYTMVGRVVKNGADAIYIPGTSMQAIEAMHVLQNVMNLKIPEDISVIGGENEGVSMFLSPPLTTLQEPLLDMARAAVEMVLKLADKEPVEQNTITFPVDLITRDSVR